MTIHYEIRAEVVDINNDEPRLDDILLVDTNVWLWMNYSRVSEGKQPPANYQIHEYPIYLKKAFRIHSKLLCNGLSLAELAHNIERIECEIYMRTTGQELPLKEFRHNLPLDRGNVLAELDDAWTLISKQSSPLETLITASAMQATLELIETRPLDGYDAYFLVSARAVGVRQILSDDGDFATVPDIQLFTANRNVIESARKQGKLLNRRRTS